MEPILGTSGPVKEPDPGAEGSKLHEAAPSTAEAKEGASPEVVNAVGYCQGS